MIVQLPPNFWTIPTQSENETLAHRLGEAGIELPKMIVSDGEIHRYGKTKELWYVSHDDRTIKCSVFGNWKTGITVKHIDQEENLSSSDIALAHKRIEEARLIAEQKKEEAYKEASKKATDILAHSRDANDSHAYLERKGVKASTGLKLSENNWLIIPVCDPNGGVQSLQYISPYGEKKFLPAGKTKCGFFCIKGKSDKRIYLCEGYATAMSVHQATGKTVFISFSAGNLINVAQMIVEKCGLRPIIVADNDESGTGEKYAKECCEKVGATMILIPKEGMDANDYAQSGENLKELLEPETWLMEADDFASKPEPLKWLVKHWLPKNALIMIHGASGSGKTFLTLDLLLHIATGQARWFGEVVHQGNVVYLCGEGHYGLRQRLMAWKLNHSAKTLGNFSISKGADDLDRMEGLARIEQSIEQLSYKPNIIAVDTLNRFYSGDENDSHDARLFIKNCSELMEKFDCSVMVIHHTGVSSDAQKRARGSSAFKGATDTELNVEKLENGSIRLECMKSKDTEAPKERYLKLSAVELGYKDEDGEEVTSAIVVEGEPCEESEEHQKNHELMMGIVDAFIKYGFLKDGEIPCVDVDKIRDWKRETAKCSRQYANNFIRENRKPIQKLISQGLLVQNGNILEVQNEKYIFTFKAKMDAERLKNGTLKGVKTGTVTDSANMNKNVAMATDLFEQENMCTDEKQTVRNYSANIVKLKETKTDDEPPF